METENKFSEVMKQRTDAELIEIVTNLRNDYQPDAVVAAEMEINSRNLTSVQIENAKEETEKKNAEIEFKAKEPLDIHWRVLCLIFPGFINFILAFVFKGQGQERKFREAWLWTFYGFGMYIVFFLLMLLIFRLFYY